MKLDSKAPMLQMKWVLSERMENRTHRLHKLQRRKPTFKMVSYSKQERLVAPILNLQLMQMVERTLKRKADTLKESLSAQKIKSLLLKSILMKSVMMTMRKTVKSLQRRIKSL